MEVYVNAVQGLISMGDPSSRRALPVAEVVGLNSKTCLVRLPDGNVIKRRRRDVVSSEGGRALAKASKNYLDLTLQGILNNSFTSQDGDHDV